MEAYMNRINNVTFHLTNSCNLLCKHCWVNAGRSYTNNVDELSIEKWKNIIKQCKDFGVGIIRYTGGEPLVKKGVDELFSYCYEQQMPFQIETNGILLTDSMVQLISNCGVRFVTVSLDSATPTFHDSFRNRVGAFDKTICAIDLLSKHAIPFQVIMCVCKENIEQIPDVIKLCEKYKMNSLKINPVNDNEFLDKSITLLKINEILELNQKIKEWKKSTTLKIVYPLPYAFLSLDELVHTKPFGCDICNRLAIMPDGKVSLCGVGISVPEMIMGDIMTTSLIDIWKHSSIIDVMRDYIPDKLEGVCSMCIHKKNCMGYCRAFPIMQTHNIYSSYHVCQKAYDENLFPSTRLVDVNRHE